MEYVVIIEQAPDGSYGVFVPDLPGCVSTGDTVEEAMEMIREAIEAHIRLMRESGEPVPPPKTLARVVTAA